MSLPSVTKAYVLEKPGNGWKDLKLVERPVAELKPNEVLVKTYAVSLNFRDIVIAFKQYPGALKDNLVPVSDAAGEVVALGSDVTEWKVGDRVSGNFSPTHLHGVVQITNVENAVGATIDGMLTQYRAYYASSLVKLPDYLSYEEAATLPCAAVTAYSALYPADARQLKAGDTVLVQGTGGVSIFALQLAVAAGATVIATSSSDSKLETAKKLGAKHTINYKTHPDWEKEVLRLTDGRGVDLVVDVGGYATIGQALLSLAQGGHVALIGFLGGSAPPPEFLMPTMLKQAVIRGTAVGPKTNYEALLRHMEANKEKTKPVIDKVFAFEDSVQAYDHLQAQNFIGKVVIKVSH